jgi:hypothetical protein
MNTLRNLMLTGTVLLGTLVASPKPCAASDESEPLNNTAPWTLSQFRGPVYNYISEGSGRGWGFPESISPTGDVDYLIMSCANTTLKSVMISFTHAFGDLDMCAYTLSGSTIGCSTGVTNNETIQLTPQAKNAIVLKVYGYAGATNPYSININCN